MSAELLDRLEIPLMTRRNRDKMSTAFTVSVDATHGISTGVSASDRAETLHTLIDPESRPDDLVQPGHIFPLRAAERGVLDRPGHTEAAVDLARLAGLPQAGVLAELVNDDGTMMRGQQLRNFADNHDLVLISIEDLIAAREENWPLLRQLRLLVNLNTGAQADQQQQRRSTPRECTGRPPSPQTKGHGGRAEVSRHKTL